MKELNFAADVKIEGAHCSLCGCSESTIYHVGLIKCNNCKFIWADMSLSSQDLEKLYSKEYFFGEEYNDYFQEEQILKFGFRIFERKLKKLFSREGGKPKLLEVGSAYGFFLDVAAEDFEVAGIEISEDACNYSMNKGYSMFQGDLFEFIPNYKFDIVVSFATLEHIQLPDRIIRRINGLLESGGYCYITTINIDSLLARIRGTKWRMIHPPTHLSYFSSSTLRLLMENNGFKVLQCKPIWQFRSLNALFPSCSEKKILYKIINRLGLAKIPIPFYFGDIIGLLAQKTYHIET